MFQQLQGDTAKAKSRNKGKHSRASLKRSSHISDLIQVSDIDRNRNVGRVAVIQEMLQPNLHRNRRDHFAKARHLQIFHTPDFQHQRTEFIADEAHSPLSQIDRIKMMLGQGSAYSIIGRRKGVHKVKRICEISPESFFLKRAETEWRGSALLRSSRLFARAQAVTAQLVSKLSEMFRLKIGAQELDRVCIGQVNVRIIIQPRQPWPPLPLLER